MSWRYDYKTVFTMPRTLTERGPLKVPFRRSHTSHLICYHVPTSHLSDTPCMPSNTRFTCHLPMPSYFLLGEHNLTQLVGICCAQFDTFDKSVCDFRNNISYSISVIAEIQEYSLQIPKLTAHTKFTCCDRLDEFEICRGVFCCAFVLHAK